MKGCGIDSSTLDISLQLLILEQAERQVEADELPGQLSFLIEVFDDLNSKAVQCRPAERNLSVLEDFKRTLRGSRMMHSSIDGDDVCEEEASSCERDLRGD